MIIAASSISPDNCNIALVPLLDANGKNLILPAIIQITIADHCWFVLATFNLLNAGVEIKAKNTAPKLNAGIKYEDATIDKAIENLIAFSKKVNTNDIKRIEQQEEETNNE